LAVSLGLAGTASAATPTWTSLASSANPTIVGSSVTFIATVRVVGGGGPPTGTVTFKDTATVLGAVTLDGAGKATLTTSALGRGTHQITAVYGGDGNFSASSSKVMSQATPAALGCSVPGFYAAPGAGLSIQRPAVGDFNQDGKPDLVGTVSGGGFGVLLGDGNGAFTGSAPNVSGGDSRTPLIADFNQDGRPDVAVRMSTLSVQVLLGDGSGGLIAAGAPVVAAGSGQSIGGLAVADLNLDRKPDLVVSAYTGFQTNGQITVLLGDGAGGLTPTAPLSEQGDLPNVFTDDFNLDGRPDVAVTAGYNPNTIRVLVGDGTGGLAAGPSMLTGTAGQVPGVILFDVNLDDKPDFLQPDFWNKRILIGLGNGQGGFSSPTSTPGDGGVVVGDFNGDGKPDIVVGSTVLAGNGTGGFQAVASYSSSFPVVAGDFNLDGVLDLGASGNNGLQILLNNCSAPASTTSLSVTPSPSAFGQSVTLTATVMPVAGSATPTGHVQFRDGATNVESPVALVGGTASLAISTLSDGLHSLTAVYGGSADFASSTSSSVSHTVLSRLTVNDVTANSATLTTLSFQVSLSAASNLSVSVSYATSDRTAKAGTDYTSTAGVLTFDPGQTTKTVSVPILQGSPGASKEFFLTLTSPTNATFSRSAGIGTIVYASSGALTMAIDDPSVKEGNTVAAGGSSNTTTGIVLLAFSVSLSKPSSTLVSATYATADGTAAAETDYVAQSGLIAFPPGKVTRSILVPVKSNTTVNGNRTLFVNLANVFGGAQVTKGQGTGTIVDDDPPSATSTVSQLRLYSPTTLEHLYTSDTNEYAVLGTRGWTQEGKAYTMFTDGGSYGSAHGTPIYRLYHAGTQQHHWTTDWFETISLTRSLSGAWDYEGISGYVLPTQETGTIPLYRLSLARPPLHLWTTDANEKLVLSTQRGWVYEGILGYVIP
jgi:hypothetical protein